MLTPLREAAGVGTPPAGAAPELRALCGTHTQDLGALQTWMLLPGYAVRRSTRAGSWASGQNTERHHRGREGRSERNVQWVSGSPSLPNNGD